MYLPSQWRLMVGLFRGGIAVLPGFDFALQPERQPVVCVASSLSLWAVHPCLLAYSSVMHHWSLGTGSVHGQGISALH